MPPKAAAGAKPKAKATAAPQHASYRDMIKDAILALKERNGSSRQHLKKYIVANNKNVSPGNTFDAQLNRAIKTGVEKGDFVQPKGASGTVKLAKKDSAAKSAADKKPAAKKASTPKTKAAAPKTKKAAGSKATTTKAKPAKKATTTKAKPASKAAKPKSNTGAKRTTKKASTAPAVVDEKKVLGKTKSGRVTKGPAKSDTKTKAKKTATKPAAKKAATPKKSATPKKADATSAA